MAKTAHAFLTDVIRTVGFVAPDGLSHELRITRDELAIASGLSREAVSKTARLKGPATQARLRDILEVINRALPWAGSAPQAFAWYRAEPLPSFGDRTAEDLVKAGQAEAVKAYLRRIALGGYASGFGPSPGARIIRAERSIRPRGRARPCMVGGSIASAFPPSTHRCALKPHGWRRNRRFHSKRSR